MSYCRTKEAIQWLEDDDVIENIQEGSFFKKQYGAVYFSFDLRKWEPFGAPMETFPPFHEWRSVTNLYYLKDLQKTQNTDKELNYLTPDDRVLSYDDPEADKTKKRWFLGGLL